MLRQHTIKFFFAKRFMSLMVDPLRPELISKSPTKTRFPRPNFISFDLWGTLFAPRKPIAEQYYDISRTEFGIHKTLQSIESEFPQVFKAMSREFPNYGKHSKEIKTSNDWWSELIVRLYGLERQDPQTHALCERLLFHFSGKDAYKLYDDVIPTLQALEDNNVRIIGATNSDYRVYSVLKSLGVGNFFPETSVFLSYDIGVAKPNIEFYRTISQKYFDEDCRNHVLKTTMPNYLENVWHVGDHYDQDFVGAVKSGWNAILLDRSKDSVFLRKTTSQQLLLSEVFEDTTQDRLDSEDLIMITNNRICVSGFGQILKPFGYDK